MSRLLFFAYALFLPSFCYGIDADKTIVKEYGLVTISHEAGETIYATFNYRNPDGTIERRILGDDHFDRRETQTTMTGPPGEYEITVGRPLIIKFVREGQPNPQPGPFPNPDPEPNPAPTPEPEPDETKVDVKSIYFFEEQQDRAQNPGQTAAMTNIDLRNKWTAQGIRSFILDDDLPSSKPWLEKIDTDLPVVLFFESPSKYQIHAVPKTAQELSDLFDRVNK